MDTLLTIIAVIFGGLYFVLPRYKQYKCGHGMMSKIAAIDEAGNRIYNEFSCKQCGFRIKGGGA